MLETLSWCNYCDCNIDADGMSPCEWSNGFVAHRRVLWKGKGRRRGIFPTMAQRESFVKNRNCATVVKLLILDFARQHSHLLRLVIHCIMGRRGMHADRCHSAFWCCCVSAKWTREGRATQSSISDASLPAKAARLRISTLSTASVSRRLLRLTIWTSTRTLQLLKGHYHDEAIHQFSSTFIFGALFSYQFSSNFYNNFLFDRHKKWFN